MKQKTLSEGEWKLMNLLWQSSPRKVSDFVSALAGDTGWTKATVNIMLSRLAEKGAVRCDASGKCKLYYPLLSQEEAEVREREQFLRRVYGGSIGMMVASMAEQKALSKADIDDLYRILEEAERHD